MRPLSLRRVSWRQRASLFAYQIVARLLQVALPIKLAKRAKQEGAYAWNTSARFGQYTDELQARQSFIWVHAVSLGETRASTALLDALRLHYPHCQLLLTHGTATGLEAGKAHCKDGDVQTWLPWDSVSAVNGFLQHYKPRFGLLIETEVWPQLTVSCAAIGLPLYLVNARLSQRSLKKAQRLKALSTLAYGALAGVVAQTQADAQRLHMLGANILGVAGNLKFDMPPNVAQAAIGAQVSRHLAKPIVMFASSREGEEAMWLQALAQLPVSQRDQVQWLIVPRHPQRVPEVVRQLQASGWQVSRRSRWGELHHLKPLGSANTVWLGDSTGEMTMYYAMSRMALLGGSFAPLGGQNLIEAGACGCVVIAGPHTFNFAQATEQALQAQACVQVPNMHEAVQAAIHLLADTAALHQRAQAAHTWANDHRGAATRTMDILNAQTPLFRPI